MNTKLKYLAGVVDLPYVVPKTGQVVTRAGYNQEKCLYLDIPHDYRPIVPEAPTPDQVRQALAVMMKPWSAYRFADADSAAAMICAVLTALSRPLLDLAPGVMIDAAQQASGKTLCASALGGLLTGKREGVTVFGGLNEEETRKRLFAGAIAGASFNLLDNITGLFRSPVYAGLLTSGSLSDRVLGVSVNKTVTVRTLLCFSGNNAAMCADLLRRVMQVRIDAGANPGHKQFSFDPLAVAIAERRQVAEAACTVWKAFYAAGSPEVKAGDVGGFVAWNRHCRQPVLGLQREGLTDGLPWGDLGDPAGAMLADHGVGDPDLASWGDALAALSELSGGVHFQGGEVLQWFAAGEHQRQGDESDLRAALVDLTSRKEFTKRSIGRVLSYRRDRVIGGLKLVQSAGDRHGATFRVVHG